MRRGSENARAEIDPSLGIDAGDLGLEDQAQLARRRRRAAASQRPEQRLEHDGELLAHDLRFIVREVLPDADHEYLLALDEAGRVIGRALARLRLDENSLSGTRFGTHL